MRPCLTTSVNFADSRPNGVSNWPGGDTRMEGIWLLVGATLSTATGVIFWFLNSQTTAGAQERQHQHDLELQRERLEAERICAHDEALRNQRIARFQPIFDVLDQLEGALSFLIAVRKKRDGEFAEALKLYWQDFLDDDKARQKIPMLLSGFAPRIDDKDLRLQVLDVAEKVLTLDREESRKWLNSNLAMIHARLEAHAVAVDRATDDN